MLNRRLIRIKVFQSIFSDIASDEVNVSKSVKAIKKSAMEMETHLISILSFLVEFSHFIRTEHDPRELKYNASDNDIAIFELITKNSFGLKVSENEKVRSYISKPTLDWSQEKDFLFMTFKQIKEEKKFKEILVSTDEDRDYRFGRFLYKYLIKYSVDFEHLMEEKNIVWYDEKIPILKAFERIFTEYEVSGTIELPKLSRDLDDDLNFAEELVNNYYQNKAELVEVMDKNTPGWESDRINRVDYVLMTLALCEFKYSPYVPVKVTINEYIEIAKMYSTPNSSKFVNGTLDKILKDWQNEGVVVKQGRGLIG